MAAGFKKEFPNAKGLKPQSLVVDLCVENKELSFEDLQTFVISMCPLFNIDRQEDCQVIPGGILQVLDVGYISVHALQDIDFIKVHVNFYIFMEFHVEGVVECVKNFFKTTTCNYKKYGWH